MSKFFQRLKQVKNILYTKYLGVTNVCTTCGLLCLGDVLIQGAEASYYKYKNPGAKSSPGGHETEIDYDRTGRIFQVGIPYGIMNHIWYKNLDKWFPGKAGALVFRKVLVDTAVAGPGFICLYFYGMALTERKGIKGSWDALKEVFIPVYTADVCYWPLAQALNFYFVPNRYRVLVISICALFWNVFLSFVQHLENDPEEDPLHLSMEQHHLHDQLLVHRDVTSQATVTSQITDVTSRSGVTSPVDVTSHGDVDSKKGTNKRKSVSNETPLKNMKKRATVSASSPNL